VSNKNTGRISLRRRIRIIGNAPYGYVAKGTFRVPMWGPKLLKGVYRQDDSLIVKLAQAGGWVSG